MSTTNSIKFTAEKILGRKLNPEEGISMETILAVEKRLKFKIPKSLRNFYLNVGNIPMFTSSFNVFSTSQELKCLHDKLIFLKENQRVCVWGTNLDDGEVYMRIEEDVQEWFEEELKLREFIEFLMYYQCARGTFEPAESTYDYSGSLAEMSEELAAMLETWENPVNQNHMEIYFQDGKLIWFFTDENNVPETVTLLTQKKEEYIELAEKFNFTEI